jgi:hypothetical protein
MSPTEADRYAPRDPEACEDIARMLGDPLPANWRDPEAVSARQDHLTALAMMAGEAAVECVVVYGDARQHGLPLGGDTPAFSRIVDELAALLQALRQYVHDTQRGDARQIIMDALTASAGGSVAAMVDGLFDRYISDWVDYTRALAKRELGE